MPDVPQTMWHEAAVFQGFPNTPDADDQLRAYLHAVLRWNALANLISIRAVRHAFPNGVVILEEGPVPPHVLARLAQQHGELGEESDSDDGSGAGMEED